jgi:hypothetical protein
MKLIGIIQNPYFQIIGLPICFLLIGVIARGLGRGGTDDTPNINDCAVCTTMLLMIFSIVVADLRTTKASIEDSLSWMLAIIVVILISIYHDRYFSWKTNSKGKLQKKLFIGVILPDLASIAVFVSYQIGKVTTW